MLQLDISDTTFQGLSGAVLRSEQKVRSQQPRILMLQGPVGPFMMRLQKFLTQHECQVWRVCFNSGDRLFSSQKNRINFAGDTEDWQRWIEKACSDKFFDAIVLFGSERPVHKIARRVAEQYGIRIISLEEGYIRPGFITVEQGGNNSCSPIAQTIPDVVYSTINTKRAVCAYNGTKHQGLYSTIYYALRSLKKIEHPELRHREVALLTEALYWLRSSYRRLFGSDTNAVTIQKLCEQWKKKYFIIALQVSSDCNLQEAALGWNSQRLITETLESFARSAPKDTRLLFKVHPRERGCNNYAKEIRRLALKHGVKDRIDVIDAGSMGLLTRHSAGMITINSTSGLSAIFHGIPLLVLGEALYSNPALATCAFGNPNFDDFWQSKWVAPVNIRHSYIAWIKRTSLKRGDFYAPAGILVACEAVAEKIFNDTALVRNFEMPCPTAHQKRDIATLLQG